MRRRVSKNKAKELIENSKGKFITVTWIKNNGEERTANGKLTNNKVTKGTGRSPARNLGYIPFYENKKGFVNIDSRTIKTVKINGDTYNC